MCVCVCVCVYTQVNTNHPRSVKCRTLACLSSNLGDTKQFQGKLPIKIKKFIS